MTFLAEATATIQCPHAAKATIVPTVTRVLVGKLPVVVQTDQTLVAGCPFQVPIGTGTKPQPCVTAKWLKAAVKVFAERKPVLLMDSQGLCQSAEQIPQGPPTVVKTQIKAVGR